MNYFEMLEIDPSVTSEDAITAAYQKARIKWQTLLAQGIGEQQKVARQLMGGQLEDAYETLMDETKRQQYLRQLKLRRRWASPWATDACRSALPWMKAIKTMIS